MSEEAKREVSLFQNTYAMIQDGSKGIVKVCVGPLNVTLSGQDRPVVFDAKKRSFVPVTKLEEAICLSPFAEQGQYVELLNPAKNNSHPGDSNQNHNPPDLEVGRKINVQGPKQFALWPGQVATVIPGHLLRSNQFLLCWVYDEDEAKKNWSSAVLKAASKLVPPAPDAPEEEQKKFAAAVEEEKRKPAQLAIPQPDLTIGKMFIIKGTDVSFFIPPTGITVIPEREDNGTQFYARDALTLEQLEYAVLVDENGKKRYPRGPSVVFPAPTERFMEQKDEGGRPSKRHRAMEMNPLQGIHLKVTADFEDEVITPDGKKEILKRHTGEELFLTGDKYPIFFPREELAVLKYDGKTKSFATAVTKGEGRYVLDRITGKIRLERGEQMLLPDPRTEVITLRPLSDDECMMLYPGNSEALEYNRELRRMADNAPTTRAGLLSEGDANRGFQKSERMRGVPGATEQKTVGQVNYFSSTSNALAMDASQQSREQNYSGDALERSSTYTKPRTITLGAKFQGAVGVILWNGFAAMIVSKDGGRRVEVGPKPLLLEYDEMLEVLAFSTGKPKNTDKLYRTVYLQLENFVTDVIEIETNDHVKIEIKLTYRTNFIGDTDADREKWFSVQNYVKYLCDHGKSLVKAAARKIPVAQFYENSTEIIRDIILGAPGADGKRKGLVFEDNNLRVRDVEVLGAPIKDESIRKLLDDTQHVVVRTHIELEAAHRRLSYTKDTEEIEQELARVKADTQKAKQQLENELSAASKDLAIAKLENELERLAKAEEVKAKEFEIHEADVVGDLKLQKMSEDQKIAIETQRQDQRITYLKAESESVKDRFSVFSGPFGQALATLQDKELAVRVAEAINMARVVGGNSISEALHKAFEGTAFLPAIKQITSNLVQGNGAPKPGSAPQTSA